MVTAYMIIFKIVHENRSSARRARAMHENEMAGNLPASENADEALNLGWPHARIEMSVRGSQKA